LNDGLITPSPRSRSWRESPSPRRRGSDTLPLALLLTVALTAWWSGLAWRDLAALRLPDPDDMVRLAQIRDWLDGQAFGDLIQARLGPPGGPAMHWSRLPDLVPASVIWLLSPLMGVTRAEIAAVIFWPELLFFLHLLLVGGLARRLGGPATIPAALAVAALAFPAIGLFLPGRIDHHGLQIVLVEASLVALVSDRLLLAGTAIATSLLVGLETLPVVAAAMLWLAYGWTARPRPVAGFGVGLIAVALAGFVVLRPDVWPAERCDGFSPPVFAMLLASGGAWLMLAGLAPRLPDARWRGAAAVTLGALLLAGLWVAAPSCFSPYGMPEPLLGRAWPAQVGEYGGLLANSPGTAIAWTGLAFTGLAAGLWLAWRQPDRRSGWLLLVSAIGISVLAAFVQLRFAWFGAALAAPALAGLVQAALIRGAAWSAGAWLVSIGLLWQAVGEIGLGGKAAPDAACTDRAALAGLDRLDTGTFAAPMELGGYLIGATQHRSLGGPYHRNAAGNRALAQLFLSSPDEARYHASLWAVDYVALCPTPTGGLPPALRQPSGLAGHLLLGAAPAWLDPVPLIGSDLLVWRVRPVAGPPIRP
jgi:hypothetical protein